MSLKLLDEGEIGKDWRRFRRTGGDSGGLAETQEADAGMLSTGQNEALRLYLRHKLKSVPSDAPTKQTLLATWMVELYLSSLNSIKVLLEYLSCLSLRESLSFVSRLAMTLLSELSYLPWQVSQLVNVVTGAGARGRDRVRAAAS